MSFLNQQSDILCYGEELQITKVSRLTTSPLFYSTLTGLLLNAALPQLHIGLSRPYPMFDIRTALKVVALETKVNMTEKAETATVVGFKHKLTEVIALLLPLGLRS